MKKYFSRKFLMTLFVMVLGVLVPLIYKAQGLSETSAMAVLGILTGCGIAYGVINLKEQNKP